MEKQSLNYVKQHWKTVEKIKLNQNKGKFNSQYKFKLSKKKIINTYVFIMIKIIK